MSQQKPQREQKPKLRTTRQPNKDHLTIAFEVKPMTEAQRQMMFAYKEGMHVIAHGSAGTGKSFVACSLALDDLFSRKVEKIVIIRSAVETRSVGFLPGSLDEKAEPYKIPYKQIINSLCNNGTAWDILAKKFMIEFITTSYVRGITLDDCVVIVDEYQNLNWHEMNSIVTRVGKNCQLIIIGDNRQCDLTSKREASCHDQLLRVTAEMPNWFDSIHFLPHDIVRSDFVKDWIITSEEISA